MKTITHKNREFKVIDMGPITQFPNISNAQPNVESWFIAKGKKGALIDGYITKHGRVIVF